MILSIVLEDLACKGFNILVYSMHIRVQDVDYESVEECAGTLAPLKFVMPHVPPPPWPHMTTQDIDHQKLCLGSTLIKIKLNFPQEVWDRVQSHTIYD